MTLSRGDQNITSRVLCLSYGFIISGIIGMVGFGSGVVCQMYGLWCRFKYFIVLTNSSGVAKKIRTFDLTRLIRNPDYFVRTHLVTIKSKFRVF